MKITSLETFDLRFPTSRTQDGTDAMHTDPDYSAAYVILKTDGGYEGHGFAFTIGRGNDICAAAIEAFRHHVVGLSLNAITEDFGGFWRRLSSDSQLRWLGPEKGVVHLALAAIVNAVWDLYGKVERKPVWKLLADMTPKQLVSCIDFRYITDALTPEEAFEMLDRLARTKGDREAELLRTGYPAYTTSVGWMGYSDDKVRAACREAIADGWTHFKVKVGADPADDARRVGLVREAIGPGADPDGRCQPAVGCGRSDRAHAGPGAIQPAVDRRTDQPRRCARACRDRARRSRPIGVATGEHCANRVIFKQLLQAEAISFCQIDSCRLGGVNENLAVMLMAAKFGVPVCPHAGGVGLCELVQHLSMFDYIARHRNDGQSRHRVRRSSARALRRPGRDQAGPLRGARASRLQQRDQEGITRPVPIPGRAGLD